MSDIHEARAVRYFADALFDRDTIGPALENRLYPVAVFHAQQVCEKGAKGCLALVSIVVARDHHASDLFTAHVIPASGELDNRFREFLPVMSRLESYYIPSRYGVDTAGRVHYLKYDPEKVVELTKTALEFLELCLTFFEAQTGKALPRSREDLEEYFLKTYSSCIRGLE
jgi:HEPN domain-containing protein